MGIPKRLLTYVLATCIYFSPAFIEATGLKFFKVKKNKNTIEIFSATNDDSDSLDSIVHESFWGKDVKKADHSVPILMYHDIGNPGEYSQRYTVSPDMFRKQLELLHKDNYVSVSLSEYVNGIYKFLPPGKKPVALTFDDATEGQFRYIDNNLFGKHLDPDCAVAILHDFNKRQPDFRMKATFFIDFVDKKGDFQVPFAQPGYEVDKIRKIIDLDMEIGNHSLEHINMKKTSQRRTKNNMRFLEYIIDQIRPGYDTQFFAYPYGAVPKAEKDRKTLSDGIRYKCIAWGGIAPDIDSKRFNRYAIPRIEINNDMKNLERYVLKNK